MRVYKAFVENDALMIEVNPLATVNENGKLKVMVLDSKVSVDENAKYRQKEISDYIDHSNKNPSEIEAEKFDLNFIRLDGNIGCLVNGAGKIKYINTIKFKNIKIFYLGLAMATMDIIKLHGGNPANFLDVGGNAGEDGVIKI